MNEALELHKDIYDILLIKKAIVVYKELAHITLKEKTNYYVCSFSACIYDIAKTKQEFANYLIDLSNSKVML